MKRTHPAPSHWPNHWRPAIGMLALLPLLAACASGTETPAQTEATGPVSPTAAASSSPVLMRQAIEDSCLDRCTPYETITATHPTLGPVEIRTYGWDMSPGADPARMQLAYALYQNKHVIDFYEGLGNTYPFISTRPARGHMMWELAAGTNIDRYGNIYLATDRSVIVLAPTETGYSQEGTLPTAPAVKPRFEIQPFYDETGQPLAGLRLGADGQANLVLGRDDEGQVRQVAILGPLGDQNSLAYTSCHSTELNCGFTFEN